MPEGHTVHRLAGAFNSAFAGKVVSASSPQGRFADGAALLDGRTLLSAEAQGKQMFVAFAGDLWLRVHLGLYGMWRFAGPGLAGFGRRTRKSKASAAADPDMDRDVPPAPRGAVRLRLLAGRHLADLSGPTACVVIGPEEKRLATARLGEDPLRADAQPARAYAKLHASRTSLAALLMRQDIVAGIGNIYRAELLFRARLNPRREGRSLAPATWAALWADLSGLLQDGVATGRIVTTQTAHRSRPTGAVRRDDAVYVAHRAGKPCHVCGDTILAAPLDGRTLYWCATCQAG